MKRDFGHIQLNLKFIFEDESQCVVCHKICKKMALAQGTCFSCQMSAVITKYCNHCDSEQLFSQREYDYNSPYKCPSCHKWTKPLACRWERQAERDEWLKKHSVIKISPGLNE
jgi:hypothetical protein